MAEKPKSKTVKAKPVRAKPAKAEPQDEAPTKPALQRANPRLLPERVNRLT